MTSQRLIIGITGALFLILRMNNLSEPLIYGPEGATGWLLFGWQLAVWLIVAAQRAVMALRTTPGQTPPGGTPFPCARLLDLTITASFGLLLWATMFAPWIFFVPLFVLHALLIRHRTIRTAQITMAAVPTSLR